MTNLLGICGKFWGKCSGKSLRSGVKMLARFLVVAHSCKYHKKRNKIEVNSFDLTNNVVNMRTFFPFNNLQIVTGYDTPVSEVVSYIPLT